MDAAAAALEELLCTGEQSTADSGGSGGPNRATLSALGWHSSVMGSLRGHESTGSRFCDQDVNMNSSSLPGDDVTSTTPPPTTTSCLPPQLSPNGRSGVSNANGAGHPTNSIRGK